MSDQSAAPKRTIAADAMSGLAAMLVAFPSAIAFGVTIFSPPASSAPSPSVWWLRCPAVPAG